MDGVVGYRTELWILFVILYFLLRLLSSLFRNAVTVMLWTLMGAGLVETIYGFGQLYGWFASGHSLYRLTGSFFNPGPYSGFLVRYCRSFCSMFIVVSRSAKECR